MNIIEQNLFNKDSLNEAIDWITPPDMGTKESIEFKNSIRGYSTDKIIFTANCFLIQDIASVYLGFFLYYLGLCNEDPSIVTINNGVIHVTRDIEKGIIDRDSDIKTLESMSSLYSASSWLTLKNIKNPILKNALDMWDITKKEVVGDTYCIKLLPANTTTHLDELYRVICAYC